MVQIVQDKLSKIKLQKGNRIIERTLLDYETNIKVWEFRGFKPVQDVVKEVKQENVKEVDQTFENESKVVILKPKKKKAKKKNNE